MREEINKVKKDAGSVGVRFCNLKSDTFLKHEDMLNLYRFLTFLNRGKSKCSYSTEKLPPRQILSKALVIIAHGPHNREYIAM